MTAKDPIKKPTDAELEILQQLWQSGPATVRTVNDQLNQHKRVGYTTTLKIMQIMADKGLLARDESKRSHVYSTLIQEKETQNLVLDRIMETAFGGSAMKLVMRALNRHGSNKEELDEIRAYLDKLEEGSK